MSIYLKSVLVISLVGMILLTACSSEEASQSSSAEAPSETSPSSSTAPQSEAPQANAPESSSENAQSPAVSSEASVAPESSEVEESSQAPENDPKELIEVSFEEGEDAVTVTFSRLPTSASDLEELPFLQTPEFAAAMYIAALCEYENNAEAVFDMVDYLNGPEDVSDYDKDFLNERLEGKYYKPFSYFEGTTPDNDYTPAQPYSIIVMENPYTHDEAGYARLLVQSSGADSERSITVRFKESTDEWFYYDNGLLADIRDPASSDPWN